MVVSWRGDAVLNGRVVLGSVLLILVRVMLRGSSPIWQQQPRDFLFSSSWRGLGRECLLDLERWERLIIFIYNLLIAIKYFPPLYTTTPVYLHFSIKKYPQRTLIFLRKSHTNPPFLDGEIVEYDKKHPFLTKYRRYLVRNSDRIYYFVQWAKEGRKPSWITAQACPQIIGFLQKHGGSLQIKVKHEQAKKQTEKPSSLPGEITEGQPIFGYLKWRSQQKMTQQRQQLGDLQKRIQSEGTPRYNQLMIQRLQAKKKQLNEQYMQEHPKNKHLDFLVDKVQGVQKSRFKKLYFVITIIGRATRYVVPMKNMKKHFPLTLRDYITDLIQVHHAKDIEEQQALLQKQAQQGAGNPNQAPMPIVAPSSGLSIQKISRISDMIAEKPKTTERRQPQNAIMQQQNYSHDEDSIYSGASQSFQ